VTIGKNSIVAAGSLVTRDVPPNTLAAGSPAKPIRQVEGWR
jgi:acetyltransferase-like isoleucine patch superfamily enzyme